MDNLQKVFEKFGFSDVRTLIASGNVLFDTETIDEEILREDIEEALLKQFGFTIPVILRTKDEIEILVKNDPFANVEIEQGARLQITFFAEEIDGKAPIEKEGFVIVYVGKREVASVVALSGKTTDLMAFVDKTFGKNSTTRNWNTVQKLLEK